MSLDQFFMEIVISRTPENWQNGAETEGRMRRAQLIGLVALVSTVPLVVLTTDPVWAIQGQTLEVTVTYTGQDGEVSSENPLYVAIFDTASMMQASPIAQAIITEDGGTASFSNLTASPVYVAAIYDTHGSFTLDQPEVPSGSPATQYVAGGSFAPAAVELTDGETTKISFQVTDLFRMP